MKTATIISKLFLLAFLLMPNAILAQNQTINVNGTQIQVSSTLQTVLDQVETVYGNPLGVTMNEMYYKGPEILPTFLGLIMQRQKIYMDQTRNIKHLDNYFNLIDQIDKFSSQLAKAHNYINLIDGSKMSPIKLQNAFTDALNGKQNANFKNNIGIDPTTVNIAYILDHSSNNTAIANNSYNNPTNTDNGFTAIQTENTNNGNVEVRAALVPAKDEAPTEINLFGEVSGTTPGNEFALARIETSKKYKMPPVDAILGAWCNPYDPNKSCATFKKIGESYVGVTVDYITSRYSSPPKKYTITTEYTVLKIKERKFSSYIPRPDPTLDAVRDCRLYEVKVKRTYNPPEFGSDTFSTETIEVVYTIESNEYKISGFSGLTGYSKK